MIKIVLIIVSHLEAMSNSIFSYYIIKNILTRAGDKATVIPKQLKTPITEAQAATMGTVKDGGLVRGIDLLQGGRMTVVPFACCAINLDT